MRFGDGEPARACGDDAEFVGISREDLTKTSWESSKRMIWFVHAPGLPILGPYDSLAHAWTSFREMDEKDRSALRMEKTP